MRIFLVVCILLLDVRGAFDSPLTTLIDGLKADGVWDSLDCLTIEGRTVKGDCE